MSVLQVHGPHLGQRGCGERLANKYSCGKEAPRPWHSAGVTDGRRARPLVLGRGQEAGELPRSGPLGSSRAKRIDRAEEWERDSVGGSNTDVDVGRHKHGDLGRSGEGKDGKRGCRNARLGLAETGVLMEPARGREPQHRRHLPRVKLLCCIALRNLHNVNIPKK